MRVLILPDSFKGTLSSADAAAAIAEGIYRVDPTIHCEQLPMADGGEGSSELAGSYVGANEMRAPVVGPEGRPHEASYFATAETAFIELAAASGFALSETPKLTAVVASTFGFGQLIDDAVRLGKRQIRLFLGGSATTDGGAGMAAALGARYFDRKGRLLNTDRGFDARLLRKITEVDLTPVAERLESCRIVAAVDVENPLCGPRGAAAIYGPQKGLDPAHVLQRDQELAQFAATCARSARTRVSGYADVSGFAEVRGAGAAGGCGFGVLALLGGTLVRGAAFFLDAVEFSRRVQSCDLVITGEGRSDSQSLQGKLLGEVARRVNGTDVPLWCFCGSSTLNELPPEFAPVRFVTLDGPDAMGNPYEALMRRAEREIRSFVAK